MHVLFSDKARTFNFRYTDHLIVKKEIKFNLTQVTFLLFLFGFLIWVLFKINFTVSNGHSQVTTDWSRIQNTPYGQNGYVFLSSSVADLGGWFRGLKPNPPLSLTLGPEFYF